MFWKVKKTYFLSYPCACEDKLHKGKIIIWSQYLSSFRFESCKKEASWRNISVVDYTWCHWGKCILFSHIYYFAAFTVLQCGICTNQWVRYYQGLTFYQMIVSTKLVYPCHRIKGLFRQPCECNIAVCHTSLPGRYLLQYTPPPQSVLKG